tara:strand:- start:556 stop:744 length:189 start_codon:yes stop_codon:yes gene_type:complete
MEILLLKDFTSIQGRKYKAGSKYACTRETYKRLLSKGICESLESEKIIKKKTKKIIENGKSS